MAFDELIGFECVACICQHVQTFRTKYEKRNIYWNNNMEFSHAYSDNNVVLCTIICVWLTIQSPFYLISNWNHCFGFNKCKQSTVNYEYKVTILQSAFVEVVNMFNPLAWIRHWPCRTSKDIKIHFIIYARLLMQCLLLFCLNGIDADVFHCTWIEFNEPAAFRFRLHVTVMLKSNPIISRKLI